MSIFKGEFQEPELKYICADYFCKPKSCDASAFFLSHCHTDHMRGLYTVKFAGQSYSDDYINDLFNSSPKATLYCSPVTALFVRNNPKIRIPKDRVTPLELGKPTTITVWPNQDDFNKVEPYQVDVTLIPAGHCPGSVMFLFELPSLRVLFTGDFRADVSHISKAKALHFSDSHLKDIDSVYLDNTFDDPRFEAFPSRIDSLQSLTDLIEDWIGIIKEGRLIRLTTSARFGSEYLFENLSKRFGKIHVEKDEFLNFYQHIPQLREAVTPNESESGPVHSCYSYSKKSCCESIERCLNIREIKPCAMSFRSKVLAEKGNVVRPYPDRRPEYFQVVYSCHSSHSEIEGILKYLNPKKLYTITCTKSRQNFNITEDSDFEKEYSAEPSSKKYKDSGDTGAISLRLFQPAESLDLSFSSTEPSSQEYSQ